MTLDETGTLWLSDPWVAGVVLLTVVGLLLWCHLWSEAGSPQGARSLVRSARRGTGAGMVQVEHFLSRAPGRATSRPQVRPISLTERRRHRPHHDAA